MAEAPVTGQLTAELVTPEQLLFADSVTMVVVPGVEGDFGVLPGHAPLISQVRPGVVDFHLTDGETRRVFVAGGFAEVTGTRCTVLAEETIQLDTLDPQSVRDRLEKARTALLSLEEGMDRAKLERELAIAEALHTHVH